MPIFNHGKNAFLALGYELSGSTYATCTLTSSSSLSSVVVPAGTLLAGGTGAYGSPSMLAGSTATYGVFAGGIPGYTTTQITSSSTSVTLAESAIGGTGVLPAVGTAGVPLLPMVNISPFINDAALPVAIDASETTTFSQAGVKTYIQGLKGYSLTFSGMYDQTAAGATSAADGVAGGIDYIVYCMENWQNIAGNFVQFVYGPSDTGQFVLGSAGVPTIKYFGQGVFTKYDLKSSVNGVVTFDGEIQVTGPVYRTIL